MNNSQFLLCVKAGKKDKNQEMFSNKSLKTPWDYFHTFLHFKLELWHRVPTTPVHCLTQEKNTYKILQPKILPALVFIEIVCFSVWAGKNKWYKQGGVLLYNFKNTVFHKFVHLWLELWCTAGLKQRTSTILRSIILLSLLWYSLTSHVQEEFIEVSCLS